MMIKKIRRGLCFVKDAVAFSNPASLIASKIFSKGNILVYRYKKYWIVSCEIPCWDGVAIKECLVEKAYNKALSWAMPKDRRGSYVNIGAHIGAFDIAILDAWGNNTTGVAIEMNPWTCARLMNNIWLNGLSVAVLNAAVMKERGIVKVDTHQSGTGQSIYDISQCGHKVDVEAITLTDIPYPVSGKPIDLLKVDCESAEYPIFMEATPECLERFLNIVMEIHSPPIGYDRDQLIRGIKEKGRYDVITSIGDTKKSLIYFRRMVNVQSTDKNVYKFSEFDPKQCFMVSAQRFSKKQKFKKNRKIP